MLDGLRNEDSPAMSSQSGMPDVQIPRRSMWPERAMRWISRAFWAALGAALAAALAVAALT